MRLVDDQAEDSKRRLVTRLVAALTIKRVQLTEDSESIPRQKSTWMLLSSRSRDALFNFLHALMQLIASEAPIWVKQTDSRSWLAENGIFICYI